MNNIQDVVQILSTCSTMKEASLALKKNERTLRKWFNKFGLPHPSTFLNTRINNLINELELTDEDKNVINTLYPDGLNKGLTVEELSVKLDKPVSKISKYIKDSKITHSDQPINITEFNGKKLNEEIKQYIDASLKKNTTEKVTDSLRKDAEKWRNWKKNVQEPLFDLLNKKVPQYTVQKRELKPSNSKYAAILALQDYHYGRLSSILEVFDATSPEEQEKLLFDALTDIFSKIQGFGTAEKCFITIGGDFVNSDNEQGGTTKGTPQDSFPSHTALTVHASFLMVRIVDFARQHFSEVELVCVKGNHDSGTSVALHMFLSAWFRETPDVISIIDYRSRQYRMYHNTLIMFHHGDMKQKVTNWPLIMANEASEFWGKSKYRMIVSGHKHTHVSEDIMGTHRIQVGSLSSEDRYSTLQGYQGVKNMSLILIDSQRGFSGEILANCS